MKYLLDTHTCIYLMKNEPQSVRSAFAKLSVNDVGISTMTLSELWYGVEHSRHREENGKLLKIFISPLVIAHYGESAAEHYGVIRAHLRKKGMMIGNMDLLIAAHAKALDVTLVTNNVREFRRVPGLKVANWVR